MIKLVGNNLNITYKKIIEEVVKFPGKAVFKEAITESFDKYKTALASISRSEHKYKSEDKMHHDIYRKEYNRVYGREYERLKQTTDLTDGQIKKMAERTAKNKANSKASKQVRAMKANTAIVKAGIDQVVKIAKAGYDITVALREAELNKFDKASETYMGIFERKLDYGFRHAENSIKNSLGTLTSENFFKSAGQSMDSMIDLNKAMEMHQRKTIVDERRYQNEIHKINTTTISKIMGSAVAIGAALGSFIPILGNGVGAIVGAAVGGIVSLGAHILDNERKLAEKREDILIKNQEKINTFYEKTYDSVKNQMKPIFDIIEGTQSIQVKGQDVTAKQAGSVGVYGKDLRGYSEAIFKQSANENIAMFGKKVEDLIKMQGEYINASDRNILMSTKEYSQTVAHSSLLGMDEATLSKTIGELYAYNISAETANKMISDTYKKSVNLGLNSKKATESVLKNLKMADKISFKNGVDSIKEMTMWAMETRFNMEQLPNIVNKITGEGILSAVDVSAKMNILGGNAAMFANPFTLMMGGNDPTYITEYITNAIKGVGVYNKKTGTTDLNWQERQYLKTLAEATGSNSEDLIMQLRTQNQKADVVRELKRSGKKFSEDEMSQINSRAKMVDGEWKVSVFDKKTSSFKDKNLKDLSKADLQYISEKDETTIIAKDSLSEVRKQTGLQTMILARLSSDSLGTFFKTSEALIDVNDSFYKEVYNDLKGFYDTYSTHSVDSQKAANKTASEILTDKNLQKVYTDFLGFGKEVDNAAQALKELKENIDAINSDNTTEILKRAGATNEVINEDRKLKAKQANNKSYWKQVSDEFSSPYYMDMKDGVITKDGRIVKIDNNDDIVAVKQGGGIDNALKETVVSARNTENVVLNSNSQIKSSVSNSKIGANGREGADYNHNLKADITVMLDSKDGKIDVTSLIRDTEGMRMLTDNVLKTIAQKDSGYWYDARSV